MQGALPYLSSAAFYLLALAAQVSGFTNSSVAIVLAAIATLLLLFALFYRLKGWWQRMGPEQLVLIGVVGALIFGGVAATGLLWQHLVVIPKSQIVDWSGRDPTQQKPLVTPTKTTWGPTLAADLPDKIKILDDALEIIRGEIGPKITEGYQLRSVWLAQVRTNGADAYLALLQIYLLSCRNLSFRLNKLNERKGFEDIAEILAPSFSEKLERGVAEFASGINTLRNQDLKNIEIDLEHLMGPRTDKFGDGINALKQWASDAEAKIRARLKDLGR